MDRLMSTSHGLRPVSEFLDWVGGGRMSVVLTGWRMHGSFSEWVSSREEGGVIRRLRA